MRGDFRDKEHIFIDLLDSNNNLIGFNNCVYDLIREEYRKGRPKDYISQQSKLIMYPVKTYPNHGNSQKLMICCARICNQRNP